MGLKTCSRIVLLSLVALLVVCVEAGHAHQELLIGWHGESYVPDQQLPEEVAEETAAAAAAEGEGEPQIISVHAPAPVPGRSFTIDVGSAIEGSSASSSNRAVKAASSRPGARWIQTLSWQPRLQLHHGFMTAEECDGLRALLSSSSGGSPPAADSAGLMQTIEERIANWTQLPQYYNEGWQLEHGFGPDERQLHMDLLIDRLATEDFQRHRAATVMLFLSDGDDTSASSTSSGNGWSLVFPAAQGGTWRAAAQPEEAWSHQAAGQQMQHELMAAGLKAAADNKGRRNEWQMLHVQLFQDDANQPGSAASGADVCSSASGSAYGALRVTGFRQGDALLLWNLGLDGAMPDASAAHVACPPAARVLAGSPGIQPQQGPWIATTWLHNQPISNDDPLGLAAACVDKNPACRHWAEQGFCDDAPGFMLGLRGNCRLSCQDCTVCTKDTTSSSPGGAGDSAAAAGVLQGAAQQAAEQAAGVVGTNDNGGGKARPHVECLYRNMHSLRAEWSQQARGAGARRARNAIRRELRLQAALAAAATAHR